VAEAPHPNSGRSPAPLTDPGSKRRHRRIFILILAAALACFATLEFYIQRNPQDFPSLAPSILLNAIQLINILLALVLVFVLGRDLIKLYIERRRKQLGSKFRTKLVVIFTGLSLVPAVLLFLVASDLLANAIDFWFGRPVHRTIQFAVETARSLVSHQEAALLTAGRSLREELRQTRFTLDRPGEPSSALRAWLERARVNYHLDLVVLYSPDLRVLAASQSPQTTGREVAVPLEQLERAKVGDLNLPPLFSGSTLTMACALPFGAAAADPKVLLAGIQLNSSMYARAAQIQREYLNYTAIRAARGSILRSYLSLLLLLMLILVFSSVWVGRFLSKEITVPIQLLAEATQKVRSGDLGHRIDVQVGDELGMLVESFNQMTSELAAGRAAIERSTQQLVATNRELEARRAYIETVLQTIATGVITLDQDCRLTTVNRAAARLLGFSVPPPAGMPLASALEGGELTELRETLEVACRSRQTIEREVHLLNRNRRRISLAVICTPLTEEGEGTLVALDDLSERIKAERAATWREVARRIAHEIKNPLTPIQLSAQRLLKRTELSGADGLQRECSQTILEEVESLKRLVDAFTRYARMPSISPEPGDLAAAIDATLKLYNGVLQHIDVRLDFDPAMPPVRFDPESLKRILRNLIDNAVEAMEHHGSLMLATHYVPHLRLARIEIADTGPGIPPEDRDRLFLPYFSTKRRGTGLGLAIVHRIVHEHHGTIAVEDNVPQGARFVIELPA
jgi:two-component system nitrogen regulation sensor histidine kinase NtrY